MRTAMSHHERLEAYLHGTKTLKELATYVVPCPGLTIHSQPEKLARPPIHSGGGGGGDTTFCFHRCQYEVPSLFLIYLCPSLHGYILPRLLGFQWVRVGFLGS